MNIQKYLSSLLPTFSKSRITGDLNDVKAELIQLTLPPLKTMVETLNQTKFSNEWADDVNTMFKSRSPVKFRGLFINAVYEILVGMEKNIPVIEDLVESYYSDNVMREAMSVMRVNILQYIETMSFVTRYSRRLCNMVLTMELDTLRGVEEPSFNAGEMAWINTRREDYFTALALISNSRANLDTKFRAIPDMVVNESNIANVTATVGSTKIDPFEFGLISARLNPIYHIGLMLAEWQSDRLNAAKAEKQALEFKLLALKTVELKKGTDPALQRRIDYVQGQVEELNYKLIKMEEKYGTS